MSIRNTGSVLVLAVLLVTSGCISGGTGSGTQTTTESTAKLTSFDTTVIGCYDARNEDSPTNITDRTGPDGRTITISESFVAESRNVSLAASLTEYDGGFALAVSNTAEADESCRTEIAYTAVIHVTTPESGTSSIRVEHDGTTVATVNTTTNGSSATGGDGVTTRPDS